MSAFPRIIFTAALGLSAGAAFAQALPLDYDELHRTDQDNGQSGGRVGAGLVLGREYQGSDESRVSVLPLLDYHWANGLFAGFGNGIGYDFGHEPGLHYGVRATLDPGRKQSRSAALGGLGDIDARAEIGGFFSAALGHGVSLQTTLRYGSGNNRNGLVASVGARYHLPLAQGLSLQLGAGATLANADYMQERFGINGAQAASSVYAPYSAGAGLRDLRASAGVSYRLQPGLNLTARVQLSSLQGDAAHSPIVREKTSTTGLVGVSYAF